MDIRWKRRLAAVSAIALSTSVLGILQTSGAAAAANANTQWSATYVGTHVGAANASDTPLTVGIVTQTGTSGDPEDPATIQAAQNLINHQLGGVSGHPIKFDVCSVQSSQDAQQCGEQFANDPSVKFVIESQINLDDTAMLSALQASKPVIFATDITSPEFADPNGFGYDPGVPTLFPAMARYTVVKLGAKTAPISMIVPVTAASQATVSAMQAAFSKAGAKGLVTSATVAAGAPATAYVSAVQAAKASTSKALIVLGLDTTCIGTAGALKSLGASPKAIVVDNGCMDQAVLQHYGNKLPANWVVFNFGNSPYVKGQSTGVNSYLAAMKQYAPKVTNIGTTSSLTFGTIMTADKIANSVGYANLTPTSMAAAAKAFTGPADMEPGAMHCGYIPSVPSICGSEMAIDQYNGKKFVEGVYSAS